MNYHNISQHISSFGRPHNLKSAIPTPCKIFNSVLRCHLDDAITMLSNGMTMSTSRFEHDSELMTIIVDHSPCSTFALTILPPRTCFF